MSTTDEYVLIEAAVAITVNAVTRPLPTEGSS